MNGVTALKSKPPTIIAESDPAKMEPVSTDATVRPIAAAREAKTEAKRKAKLSIVPTPTEPINVKLELEANIDFYRLSYKEGQTISMLRVDESIFNSVNKVRASVELDTKPGQNPTLACCVISGWHQLKGNGTIVSFLKSKERFDLASPDLRPTVNTMIDRFFSSLDRGIGLTEGKKRINPVVNKDDCIAFTSWCIELGVLVSDMAILCAMLTLSNQDQVNAAFRMKYRAHVDSFIAMVKDWTMGAEALLDKFKIPIPEG